MVTAEVRDVVADQDFRSFCTPAELDEIVSAEQSYVVRRQDIKPS
jgi:hypothetical protein